MKQYRYCELPLIRAPEIWPPNISKYHGTKKYVGHPSNQDTNWSKIHYIKHLSLMVQLHLKLVMTFRNLGSGRTKLIVDCIHNSLKIKKSSYLAKAPNQDIILNFGFLI